MNVSMMSDHIVRMEKFDNSYRCEYETALKHAAATTLHGKTLRHKLIRVGSKHISRTGAADTVCASSLEYMCVTYETHRRVQR